MATAHSKSAARLMIAPAVFVLLVWMLIPLCMTLYFSFADFRPMRGIFEPWIRFQNYQSFLTSSSFMSSLLTTLWMVAGILSITIIGGVIMALLLDRPMFGHGIVQIRVIVPFFVMSTVSALVWKNMFFNVDNGLFSYFAEFLGLQPYDLLTQAPWFSIIMIVAWQWLPFATLILLTAVQSLDSEQLEAAEMDNAPSLSRFRFIILPHLSQAITVVILIQTIFLLSIFAEIFVTTNGAFGTRTLTYLFYQLVLESQNIGLGFAGGGGSWRSFWPISPRSS
jgi:sorbitol/mannitol transport system permease protein